jgi:hypothetical protein
MNYDFKRLIMIYKIDTGFLGIFFKKIFPFKKMLHKSPVQFYIPTIPLIIVKENKIIRLRTYKLDKKKILKNRT